MAEKVLHCNILLMGEKKQRDTKVLENKIVGLLLFFVVVISEEIMES